MLIFVFIILKYQQPYQYLHKTSLIEFLKVHPLLILYFSLFFMELLFTFIYFFNQKFIDKLEQNYFFMYRHLMEIDYF